MLKLPKSFAPLTLKLLRDLWAMRGQVMAVSVVVACGVTLFITMNGTLISIKETRSVYYERYKMADIWAPVSRAPMHKIEQLKNIEGVISAVGRISSAALIDMPSVSEPVRAKVVSLPRADEVAINDLYLKLGKMPNPQAANEIVVSDDYAEVHGLTIGDEIKVTLYGVKRRLKIIGMALSPEFVYSIPPGEMMPNPARFAILWMPYNVLANAYDLDGAFNEAVLKISSGVNKVAVLKAIDDTLEPYGSMGAYLRDKHISDEFISSELKQLEVIGSLIPYIFLGVAAFLLNIVITRIMEQERKQIGLMKAFGYRRFEIAFHYLAMAGVIVAIGVVIGWFGGARMGRGMANLYMDFYKFPLLIFEPGYMLYLKATLVAVGAAGLGTIFALRKMLILLPAVAMSPPMPTDYSGLKFLTAKAKWMDQGLRIMLRHILRWPMRSLMTAFGIALGMAIMVGAQSTRVAMDKMIALQFDLVSKQDLTIIFNRPRDISIVHELSALKGVLKVEPYRMVRATISNGHIKRDQSVTGIVRGAELNVLVNEAVENVVPPAKGLILSTSLAEALQAELGDMIDIEARDGRQLKISLPFNKQVSTNLGTPAFAELGVLNAALGDGDWISGAYLSTDPNDLDGLYARIKEMAGVAGVFANKESRAGFKKTMDEVMGTMTFFNTIFASLIAIGVVFSSARISFSEREREIASLRVLGFTKGEVNVIMLGELALLTCLSFPMGAVMGYQLAATLAKDMSSELFRVPVDVSLWAFGYAVSVVIIASIGAGLMMARQVSSLDMIVALKTRE